MSNENEINFIPTRYEDRGDSFYFTNEEDGIVVPKHTILADNYMDALVKIDEPTEEVVEEQNAPVETDTTPTEENTQVEPEVAQEEPNLDNETTPEVVEESNVPTDENGEVVTEETTDTEVEVSDESTEGNL
jgi:hypothetical protein